MTGGGCEAVWVTQPNGHEKACGAPATRVRQFETATLLVCAQCDADLSDFDLYHVEQELTGPLDTPTYRTGQQE